MADGLVLAGQPGSRNPAELLSSGPAQLRVPDARRRIRDQAARSRTKVVVLDDDPTGSQSVQRVPVLTDWSVDNVEWAFDQPPAVFFVLTNTRGRGAADTRGVVRQVIHAVDEVARRRGRRYIVISRSDSTLRGHYPLETDVLTALAAEVGGPYDAVLIAPAYFEAGRVTAGDVHYARVGDVFVPIGATDYAGDATFGFRSSNLREYVEEKTAGRVAATDVVSLSLDDIRLGGPDRVAERLRHCRDAAPVVVNALTEADLEVVVLGALAAEQAGTRLLYRTGPSFVPIRAGLDTSGPVARTDIFPRGERPGRGLVVVGSHVELTTRQVDALLELPGTEPVELDVPSLLDPARGAGVLQRCGEHLLAALTRADAVLVTSRRRVTGTSAESSLDIARRVSEAVVRLVAKAHMETELAWVIAKGGITASYVATAGLHIGRAHVLGQLFPGVVSVWVTDDDSSRSSGLPYVVFAGNVGDERSLRDAVRILRGGHQARGGEPQPPQRQE